MIEWIVYDLKSKYRLGRFLSLTETIGVPGILDETCIWYVSDEDGRIHYVRHDLVYLVNRIRRP